MGEGASHDISIHALREEGDTKSTHFVDIPGIFLSTPSARRATALANTTADGFDISIHALREEGDAAMVCAGSAQSNFYPRPPRGGRRPSFLPSTVLRRFLSTPSARRATLGTMNADRIDIFLSTPSARRATWLPWIFVMSPRYFYPRPPRGGRHIAFAGSGAVRDFYPRPPRGGRRNLAGIPAG